MTRASRLQLVPLCLLLAALPAAAQDRGAAQPQTSRVDASPFHGPGVVLVLSGGGRDPRYLNIGTSF